MSKKTIGFFGDSFCRAKDPGNYIDIVARELDLKVTHLGVSGSSVDDLIIKQFTPLDPSILHPYEIKVRVPDVCVFCWTESNRLFNNLVRNINGGTVENIEKISQITEKVSPLEDKVWEAASFYYRELYDHTWHKLRHNSMIYYFNKYLLAKHSDKKIINLWSFGDAKHSYGDPVRDYSTENTDYPFRFDLGMELRPALMSLSLKELADCRGLLNDTRPNHMASPEVNRLLVDSIIQAITNYESGKLIEMDLESLPSSIKQFKI
jgi:hypothetical protein